MKNPQQLPPRSSGSMLAKVLFVAGVLILFLVIAGLVAGVAVLRSLRQPIQTSELRSDLLNCLAVSRTTDVEITLPGWVTTLARVGASVSHIDPQLNAALQTLHSGQIGAYELAECPSRSEVLDMLSVADAKLGTEGWTRLVTVLENDEMIAVYALDSSLCAGKPIEVFVVVMDHCDLVMVAASGYAEPLFELAASELRDGRL